MNVHVIADTRMRRDAGEHWTLCICGELLEADSSLALEDAWIAHRRANGALASKNIALLHYGRVKVQPTVRASGAR